MEVLNRNEIIDNVINSVAKDKNYGENEIFFLKLYVKKRIVVEEHINGNFKSQKVFEDFVNNIVSNNRLNKIIFTEKQCATNPFAIAQIDNNGILSVFNTDSKGLKRIKSFFSEKKEVKALWKITPQFLKNRIDEIVSVIMHELSHACHGKQPSESKRREYAEYFFSLMPDGFEDDKQKTTKEKLEEFIYGLSHFMAEGFANKMEALIRSNRS